METRVEAAAESTDDLFVVRLDGRTAARFDSSAIMSLPDCSPVPTFAVGFAFAADGAGGEVEGEVEVGASAALFVFVMVVVMVGVCDPAAGELEGLLLVVVFSTLNSSS